VDDVPIATNEKKELKLLLTELEKSFKFKYCGNLDFCLGLKIKRNREKNSSIFHSLHYPKTFLKDSGLIVHADPLISQCHQVANMTFYS